MKAKCINSKISELDKKLQTIKSTVTSLFKTGVNIEKDAPDVLEATIFVPRDEYEIRRIELSLYAEINKYFMLIDDFRFEYEDIDKATREMEAYLEAIRDKRAKVESRNFLGFKFAKRLVIT